MTNTELVERYPFLKLRNVWTGELIEDYDPERDGTWLDHMPTGWRNAFGEQLCEELKAALDKAGVTDKYFIDQIKEKFGGLRWYDSGNTKEGYEILAKYEDLSYRTCIDCGKPAKWITRSWISLFCDDCIKEINEPNPIPIDEFYKENF